MALNIKDPTTDRLVRKLAAETGEGVTTAIRKSVEERLHRLQNRRKRQSLLEQLTEIADHCAALPDLDTRSADEILGYDENGLPS